MDTGGNRGLNLFPPMDALAEVQIKTSNYTADSGSYGYGMVNVVTKTGGNEFHGDLYEILGNDAVDARNFFDNQVAPFKQNIFGFTIGGPVFIPRHYNADKNKTFFFYSEGWNRRQGPQLVNFTSPPTSTFTATTIDALQRQGNFSGQTATVKDPTTGQPFPGNIIPASRIDPNATNLISRFYPLPNRSGSPNFGATPNSASKWREEMFRVDQMFTQNFILTLRYAHDSWSQDQELISPGLFIFPPPPLFLLPPEKNPTPPPPWPGASPPTVYLFTSSFPPHPPHSGLQLTDGGNERKNQKASSPPLLTRYPAWCLRGLGGVWGGGPHQNPQKLLGGEGRHHSLNAKDNLRRKVFRMAPRAISDHQQDRRSVVPIPRSEANAGR